MENTKQEKRSSLYEFNEKYGDPWIWGIFIALIIISIVENYSASSREVARMGIFWPFLKHTGFLCGGAFLTWWIARKDYNKTGFLAVIIPVLALFTLGGLVYVLFFGKVINGAQRAIHVLGFTLQPAEFAKLSIVTLLAYVLAVHQKDRGLTNRGFYIAIAAVGVYSGLMIRSGLTNCAIIGALCVTMLLIGGASFKKIIMLGVVVAMLSGVYFLLKSNGDKNEQELKSAETELAVDAPDDDARVVEVADAQPRPTAKVNRWAMRFKRITNWWNNDSLVYWAVTPENQQEVFSRMAQAHGGVVGVGMGQSRECSRLPLAFSDYIYSIIIEETGFVGGMFVMLLYLSLLGRAFIIVRKCNRALPTLLIIGIASLITYQALFHMAINTGVFPVSGQPLPLISNGGSAILVISIAFGIMLSVSRTIAVNKNVPTQSQPEPELPAGLDTENPMQIAPKNVWK